MSEVGASQGDLAIVLHSHMPYVEGFGTYPFGEEWLFDAVVRSYLPVLEVADRVTLTVTPVLADQLEAPGVGERLRRFVAEVRLGGCERDAAGMMAAGDALLAAACREERERYRRGLERLDELDANVLDAFREAQGDGRIELMGSAATHAVLPMLATRQGRRLQIDAGLRSHCRRFSSPRGFWLPECGYEPGTEELLAERDLEYFCVDQSAHEAPLAALSPVATKAGPLAFTIDWEAVSWLWSLDGYPSDPRHRDFHRQSYEGARPWAIDGDPYDPAAARDRAREQARDLLARVAERLGLYRDRSGRRGVVVFAIDTELLGHWWWEGPVWLREVVSQAPAHGVQLVTLGEAAGYREGEERPLRPSTWGEAKDLRTWDAPSGADLAWGARRLELRLLSTLAANHLDPNAATRAARELLALQASDWAFLDSRRQAGDYPFQRATDHAHALLEAIDSVDPPDPRMRNLAPDLRLAPLMEP